MSHRWWGWQNFRFFPFCWQLYSLQPPLSAVSRFKALFASNGAWLDKWRGWGWHILEEALLLEWDVEDDDLWDFIPLGWYIWIVVICIFYFKLFFALPLHWLNKIRTLWEVCCESMSWRIMYMIIILKSCSIMRFELLMVMNMTITILWDMMWHHVV